MKLRVALGVAVALLATGCATWPADRLTSCPLGWERPQIVSLAGGRRSTRLTVLIYNVEGLPWPARKGRGSSLDRIGSELSRMRGAGSAPDIVLMQEVFTARAARIGERAGYRNAVRGPTRADIAKATAATPAYIADRRRKKGERSLKLLGSGLYVLSDYPVRQIFRQGYSRYSCAGVDCLSAKGMMLIRVVIPGMPTPLDMFTTHMNAGKAARVSRARAVEGHQFQSIESARFIDRTRDLRNPLIIGGDFNMRRNRDRFDFFSTVHPYEVVHRRCVEQPARCRVLMSWDGDQPWLDTQDLQAFSNGQIVSVDPVQVEALFDGPRTGGKLSDHDGLLVTYRLSWPADARALQQPCD